MLGVTEMVVVSRFAKVGSRAYVVIEAMESAVCGFIEFLDMEMDESAKWSERSGSGEDVE